MNILHLSNTGTDTVTFWSSPEKPHGCLVQFPGHPIILAVAALRRPAEEKATVGLFEMSPQLYHDLGQELQGGTLEAYDFEFISSWNDVYAVRCHGGISNALPEVAEELNRLELKLQGDGIGVEIRDAIIADQRRRGRLF
jgi:hypothetical protein